MENQVLGTALEGMEDEEESDKEEDPNISSAANLDEQEREQLREQVYDAMEEKPQEGTAAQTMVEVEQTDVEMDASDKPAKAAEGHNVEIGECEAEADTLASSEAVSEEHVSDKAVEESKETEVREADSTQDGADEPAEQAADPADPPTEVAEAADPPTEVAEAADPADPPTEVAEAADPTDPPAEVDEAADPPTEVDEAADPTEPSTEVDEAADPTEPSIEIDPDDTTEPPIRVYYDVQLSVHVPRIQGSSIRMARAAATYLNTGINYTTVPSSQMEEAAVPTEPPARTENSTEQSATMDDSSDTTEPPAKTENSIEPPAKMDDTAETENSAQPPAKMDNSADTTESPAKMDETANTTEPEPKTDDASKNPSAEEDKEENTEGDEAMEGEEDGAESDNEGTDEKEDEEEDVGNLQLAWEMLDLSKVIFRRHKGKESQLKAAQAHLKLGEVSIESENYTQAVEDFLACLKIQKVHLEEHDRLLAETHYQLGLAHQYSGTHEAAISHFTQSIEVIEKRMAVMTEKMEKEIGEAAELQQEMDELKGLLPDIREKIEDSKDAQKSADITEQALGESLSGGRSGFSQENGGTSASAAPEKSADCAVPVTNCVSDISHLVRKKRKPEEESHMKEAKKPKSEPVGNGDAVVPTSEKVEEAEAAETVPPMETTAVASTA